MNKMNLEQYVNTEMKKRFRELSKLPKEKIAENVLREKLGLVYLEE